LFAPEYIDRVFKRLLQNPLSYLAQRLASQCAVCRAWPSEPVCSACTARFVNDMPRCKRCAIALSADLSIGQRIDPGVCIECIQKPPPIDAALAVLDYAYPWSGLISRFKFGETPSWAIFFAATLWQTPAVRQAFTKLQSTDLILPVPLSKERLQTRGFNQAWELASALAKQSGCAAKADGTLLLRVKNTRPQSELLRQERLANVKGAFQVDPLRVYELKGRRVILVDDVMTSGASLFTAAEALRAAGASHITGLILARTPR
jgi:ComF family protein